jgi:alkylation response protein AidB-like acyl-CoA dehydrogenase
MIENEISIETETQDLIKRSLEVRKAMYNYAVEVDAKGDDPTENFRLIFEAGLNRISLPVEYGGLSTGELTSNVSALLEIQTNISAGDGSTGQNWGTSQLNMRELFNPHTELPETTRRQLAQEILENNLRFVASNAETGTTGRVTSRKVAGGIILNGTKSFNTNSGGRGIANVGHVLEGVEGRHHALVRLDAPGVIQQHDWDNMGQRATHSQTITYEEVFVPDGWHFHDHGLNPIFIPFVFLLHGSLMLGIGLGGFDAMVEFVRTLNRPSIPGFKSATEDPLIRWHVGDISTKLAAALALQREVAREVENFKGGDPRATVIQGFRSKVASVEASLAATSQIHELTGARSTSNKFRLDRFWRNSRTFASHDPTDAKLVGIGAYELTGELVPVLPGQASL